MIIQPTNQILSYKSLFRKITMIMVMVLFSLISHAGLMNEASLNEFSGGQSGILELNSSYLNIEPLTLTGDFTIESWVYFKSGETIGNEDGIVASADQDINFANGSIRVFDRNSGRDQVVASTASITAEWTHYAIVRNNGSTSIYINGQLDATSQGIWNNAFIIEHLGTGNAGVSNGTGSTARFDDIMIWNTARSANQVTSDMRRNIEGTGGLLRRYTFDDEESIGGGGSTSEEIFNGIGAGGDIETETLTGNFTVQAWMYFAEGDPITNEDGIVASVDQDINFHLGQIRVFDRNAGNDQVIANTAATTGVQTHYAIVREAGITKIYIDGVLDATSTTTWTNNFTINRKGTGIKGVTLNTGLNGKMSDLQILNSALSVNEIIEGISNPNEDTPNPSEDIPNPSEDIPNPSEEIFNGTGAGVAIETETLTGNFTVQAWMYFAEGDPITNEDGIVASVDQDINFANGTIRVFDRNAGKDQVVANTAATTGVQTHYAIVREAGITKIYIDGVLDATSTTTWTNNFTINRKGTGIRGITLNTGLNGKMSDLQILNSALSVNEIIEGISNPNGAEIITANGDNFLDVKEAILPVESFTLTGDFTVESWVTFDNNTTIDNQDGLVASTSQDINFWQDKIRVFSNNRDQVVANTIASPGVRTHYAIVRENGITSIYINGQIDATAASNWNNDFVIDHIGTGVKGITTGIGLGGQLDDFVIWNSARSAAQITQDMNGNIGSSNDLAAYYSFCGIGPVALDESGNNRNLALPSGAILVNGDNGGGDTTIDPINGNRAVQVANSGLTINEVTLTDGFSISAWVYFDENDPIDANDILAQGDGWSIDFDNGVFNVSVDELGGSIVATNTPIEKGKWAFYTAVREDGFVELFINGNFERSSKIDDSSTRGTVNNPWVTNIVVSEIYTGMNAVIDDFRIYNSSRSQAQLQSDLTGTLEGVDGIVRYYSFNGEVDAIIDNSGNSGDLARESGTEFTGFIAPFVVPRVANEFGSSQVVNDLILPTDLDFLPDNRLIVVEKSGLVKLFADGTKVGSESGIYLDLTTVTNNVGERGMLAVVVDPEFENNGYVYLYNTFLNANNSISKAVVRYTHIEGAGGANSKLNPSSAFIIWREQEVPLGQAANVHHGGGLDVAFEPNEGNDPSPYKMYIVTSDESIPSSSGNLGSDNGKVHRINLTDGSIPTDNPYYEAAAAANYNPQDNVTSSVSSAGILTTVHSSGVRNGWRASYDQVSGHLLFGEVGGNKWEDVHVAVPRADYGWQTEEGPLNNPNDPGNPILSYSPTNGPGLNDIPSSGSASITGGVVYRGGKFPAEFEGAYFYGDWTRQWIRYAKFDFSGERPVLIEDKFFSNSTGRPLSFEEGPDGALYYITTTQSDGDVFVFEGQVNRLSFDSDNTAPFGSGILVDAADLITGTIPHTVQFGSNVTDAEGDAITYSWSFGDGSFSTDENPEHTFTAFGEYQVTLIATDANGAATAFNSVFIRIGNVPTINIQASQTNTYRAGDVITIDGSATDAIDGTIASGNLSWSSSYATDGADRPGPFENNTPYSAGGITFTTPNFGNVESFLNSVTVSLKAENSNGLFASKSITLIAETSSITIDAPNEEVLIGIDGHITTPGDYTFEGIVNFLFDFEADAQYEINGQTFSFSHWSDTPSNTNPIRQIAMPAVPTTITPIYVSGEVTGTGTTLYKHCAFGGTSISLVEGDYPNIANEGFLNNDLSSIKVPNGFQVILYASTNFGGNAITLTADDGCLVDNGFNDNAASLKIINLGDNAQSFIPDPNKTYYLDVPQHNLRLAATGQSQDAYTTPTNTTGADVEWKFVDKGNDFWHLQRAAGGSTPRLRTDGTLNADMQSTGSVGVYTYYRFDHGATSGTHYITLPDGPAAFQRLQMTSAGEMRFVTTASGGDWVSWNITEVNNSLTLIPYNPLNSQVDDCISINISASTSAITISNLVAAVADIQILDENNMEVVRCAFNCGETESFDLPAGTYRVAVKKFSTAYAQICEKIELVTIGETLTGEESLRLIATSAVGTKTKLDRQKDATAGMSMKIAPNPVRDQFTVNFQAIKGETYHLSVIDLLSKVHHQEDFVGEAGNMKLDLNSRTWEGGLYFLVLESEIHAEVKQMVIVK